MTLLDRNIAASRRVQVDGGQRTCHIERDAMRLRQHSYAVRADFVGDIAVSRDAVRSDDDRLNPTLGHNCAGHVIADERDVDARLLQFKSRQPRALQHGSCFIGEHFDVQPLLLRQVERR
ncbi:hypothetical protein D3C85_1539180 [compost metagenome]